VERRWLGLVAGSALVVAAVGVRSGFAAPWWWVLQNLALAWIPVALGFVATRSRVALAVVGPAWLVFLPNAPYLLTDLVHLAPRATVPLWYDACLLGGLGALGLALGACSLADVAGAAGRLVTPHLSRALQLLVPPLCGFGMVLGRELRFNSWDLATDPGAVLAASARLLLRPEPHGELLAMAVVFGASFWVAAACVGPDDYRQPVRPSQVKVAAPS
jgi:uncharacterized membrane protein